jgi:hypothetical protein
MDERQPPRANDSVGARVLSAALIAIGTAIFVSAALTFQRMGPAVTGAFVVIAIATLSVGLVLARRSGLAGGWVWSGRSWAELLTPGGPVRTPFEWIRVGIATALGAGAVLLVACAVRVGAGWLRHASVLRTRSSPDAAVEQGIATAVGVFALIVGLAALLLTVLAIVSLAVGVIGLGLRSGASSMSLRDWVSLDKRN